MERAADSCLFIPVPHEIKYGEAEKSGLEMIAAARDREDRSQLLQTDVDTLERAIEQVLELVERVSNYVSNVLDEEAEVSPALGQYLMNTLSLAPKVDAEEIEKDLYVPSRTWRFLCAFFVYMLSLLLTCARSNNHIQDTLLVSYLANTIRTQIDLSNRLATATLTMGGGSTEGASTTGGEQRPRRDGQQQNRSGGGGQRREPREPREPREQ